MKIKTIAGASAVAAVLLAAAPASATVVYENCAEARADGVYNLSTSDPRAAGINDPDGDGVVCENGSKPKAPVEKGDSDNDDSSTVVEPDEAEPTGGTSEDTDLAETGGDSNTPYIAAAGGFLLLGGASAVMISRRRKSVS